jgi:chromosomal replication initiation ATPase DnaA
MKPALTSERIERGVDIAAKVFEVPHREILSKGRIPSVTRARLALYAALYDGCQTSYTEMGWRLQRDHSTLVWGVKQARAMAADDPEYATALARVCAVVRYGY